MNEKNRRYALKSFAVGAPVLWTKPVISTAIIPAHAATTFGACANVNFSAGSDESSEVGNIELEFETLDPELDAVTWEATFSSEDSITVLNSLDGNIEFGNGGFSNPEFNVVVFESGPAVGNELTVNIVWEGGSCSAETTIFDDPD